MGRRTYIVRRIWSGSTEPYSPNPRSGLSVPACGLGIFDDEEPKPGTLGESRRRTAAMPRLGDSIHAERPAEVLDKGRAACRGDVPTQCLEKLIRLRVDRCYRENGPSRLVRTLAPTAAHQNLARLLSNEHATAKAASGNALCGRRCRAMSPIGSKAENMCSI
jgi:hypothetical protein